MQTEILEAMLSKPRGKQVSANQIDTLRKFYNWMVRKNFKPNTIEGKLNSLICLGIFLKKDYQKMTKEDVNKFLSREMKPSTRNIYQIHFLVFFRWLGKKNVDKWFEKIEVSDNTLEPSKLWSPQEVESLIRAFRETMHRALVATLYDSGARVGEICSMNIEDVEFVIGNATIFLRESKTQRRRVELIFASKELLEYYNIRKTQAQPNGPLWVSRCGRTHGKRLTPGGVEEILRYGCRLLGTTKKLYPHLMRHSCASYLRAHNCPDVFLRQRFGWKPGSTMVERYTHITDQQVANAAKKAFGIKTSEVIKEEPNPLIGRVCPRCGTVNRSSDTLCSKCWLSLDYRNTEMELALLEMFRTNFVKATNLDVLFHDYRRFKQELDLVENFKILLQGKTTIETEIVRKYFTNTFKLDDDQAVHFIETLMQEGVADVEGDFIVLTSMEKLDDLIQSCKKFVSLDSKYKVTKE